MIAKTQYSLDDLQSDVTHLSHLLDEVVGKLMECDYGSGENRNHTLDRAAALAWIARDLVERTERLISENFRSLRTGR